MLQQGEFTLVGGRVPMKANVRIIAATHRDLRGLIAQGTFREDLYFRLNVVPSGCRLCASGWRISRTLSLTSSIRRWREGLPRKTLNRDAIERLKRYRWPGNVRELENLVQRISAVYVEDVVGADAVETELRSARSEGEPALTEAGEGMSLSAFAESWLQRYFASFEPELPPPGVHLRMIREVEAPTILAALVATGGNQLKAAELWESTATPCGRASAISASTPARHAARLESGSTSRVHTTPKHIRLRPRFPSPVSSSGLTQLPMGQKRMLRPWPPGPRVKHRDDTCRLVGRLGRVCLTTAEDNARVCPIAVTLLQQRC